jgi:hypothetical protein
MYKQRNDDEVVELPLFKYIKTIAILSSLFSTLLLCDYLLPAKKTNEIVLKRIFEKESNRFGGTNYNLKIATQSFEIKAGAELFEHARETTPLEIYYSPIFNFIKLVKGKSVDTHQYFSDKPIEPIFRGYASFPITLLFLGLISYFYKKEDTIAYVSGILSIIVLTTILMII